MAPRKRQATSEISSKSTQSKKLRKEQIIDEPESQEETNAKIEKNSTSNSKKQSKKLKQENSSSQESKEKTKETKTKKIPIESKVNTDEEMKKKSPKLTSKEVSKSVTSATKSTSKKDSSKEKNQKKTIDEEKNADKTLTKKNKKIKKENTTDEDKDTKEGSPVDKKSRITREMVQYSQKWVGAHVSIAGGLYKAIEEACSLESNAFGLFLRSQRRWESPPLTQKSIDEFEKTMKAKKFGCSTIGNDSSSYFNSIKNKILPHGSYLINLGNPDQEKRDKSYKVFLDDLKRCDALSIALYNFHPGSTCGLTSVKNSIELIADCINKAHKETKNVKILIENMAGQGNIVGSKFEEIADIINLVENKDRVGVCLDTCHLFAAGYDVRTAETWNKTLDEFGRIVGLKYFAAMHLNDSKGPLGCNKDRHESLGKGHIGLDCFRFIMEDSRFSNMPLILETPDEKLYYNEIQLLHSFLKSSAVKKEKKN